MSMGITDLSKWARKTAEAVERICLSKEGLPICFAIVFFDPSAQDEKRWNFAIQMAYDPHSPPPEEDRKRIEAAIQHIMDGVVQIMDADSVESVNDYSAKGFFH